MSGATEPPVAETMSTAGTDGGWAQGLRTRIIFGLLMAAIAIAAIASGDRIFALFVGIAAVILAWEWTRLCGEGRFGRTGLLVGAAMAAVVLMAFFDRLLLAMAGAVLAALVAFFSARAGRRANPAWVAAGMIYVGIPVAALIWLRGHDASGERMIFWLLTSVAMTDIGAYFAGRLIGGPKLAPRISPKKTWAGLIGAMVASATVGAGFALVDPLAPAIGTLAVAGAGLAVVGQAGDLLESSVKRRFGVKDSSNLIPGHGGLLDRVDGLIAAAAALALFQWTSAGSVLAWR